MKIFNSLRFFISIFYFKINCDISRAGRICKSVAVTNMFQLFIILSMCLTDQVEESVSTAANSARGLQRYYREFTIKIL